MTGRATVSGCRFGGALAAGAALVPVPLDLPRELVRDEVDRVPEVGRRLACPQRDALQIERRLGHLAVRDRRVLLLEQLELEPRELRYLLRDLPEALVHVSPEVLGHGRVARPDLDSHFATLLGSVSGPIVVGGASD